MTIEPYEIPNLTTTTIEDIKEKLNVLSDDDDDLILQFMYRAADIIVEGCDTDKFDTRLVEGVDTLQLPAELYTIYIQLVNWFYQNQDSLQRPAVDFGPYRKYSF